MHSFLFKRYVIWAHLLTTYPTLSSISQFTSLLGGSILYDIIWMVNHEQGTLTKLLTIVLLLLKVSSITPD